MRLMGSMIAGLHVPGSFSVGMGGNRGVTVMNDTLLREEKVRRGVRQESKRQQDRETEKVCVCARVDVGRLLSKDKLNYFME